MLETTPALPPTSATAGRIQKPPMAQCLAIVVRNRPAPTSQPRVRSVSSTKLENAWTCRSFQRTHLCLRTWARYVRSVPTSALVVASVVRCLAVHRIPFSTLTANATTGSSLINRASIMLSACLVQNAVSTLDTYVFVRVPKSAFLLAKGTCQCKTGYTKATPTLCLPPGQPSPPGAATP